MAHYRGGETPEILEADSLKLKDEERWKREKKERDIALAQFGVTDLTESDDPEKSPRSITRSLLRKTKIEREKKIRGEPNQPVIDDETGGDITDLDPFWFRKIYARGIKGSCSFWEDYQ